VSPMMRSGSRSQLLASPCDFVRVMLCEFLSRLGLISEHVSLTSLRISHLRVASPRGRLEQVSGPCGVGLSVAQSSTLVSPKAQSHLAKSSPFLQAIQPV
jgi:hypothetical protein